MEIGVGDRIIAEGETACRPPWLCLFSLLLDGGEDTTLLSLSTSESTNLLLAAL
jgi:hypothetical protein